MLPEQEKEEVEDFFFDIMLYKKRFASTPQKQGLSTNDSPFLFKNHLLKPCFFLWHSFRYLSKFLIELR